MSIDLQNEIAKFRSFAGSQSRTGAIELTGRDILRYAPKIKTTRTLKVGFLGLIHGNEILGLPITSCKA